MHGLIGNMGLAIIGLTLMIKLILFPLAYKSYVSMSKMKALQPEMEKIKETGRRRPDEDAAGDDGALQAGEGQSRRRLPADPAADPDLLLALQGDLRHHRAAPRAVLRLDPATSRRPTRRSILNLFGLLPWAAPAPTSPLAILSIGVWPILLGISMWLQQKLNPAPTDKTQAMIFTWMPWIFMFMLGQFARGLVIYWVANNTITFTQQYLIMRSQGVKPNVLGNIRESLRRGPKAAPAAAPAATPGRAAPAGRPPRPRRGPRASRWPSPSPRPRRPTPTPSSGGLLFAGRVTS